MHGGWLHGSAGSQSKVHVTNNGTFAYGGGTASIGPLVTEQPGGTGTLQIAGGTNLAVDSLDQSFLSVGPGARFTIRAGGSSFGASRTNVLTISPGATMDLNNNALVVDYIDVSPLATIRGQIISGYAAGAWTGPGITSSVAAAEPDYGLSYAASTELFGSFPAAFAGRSVDSTAVLVLYTRYGDADLNGVVNLNDFNRLAANFGTGSGAVWSQGDFTYDGIVNLADFNRLAANFGLSAGADGVVDPEDWAALVVPEAVGAVTLGLLSAGVLLARRNRG